MTSFFDFNVYGADGAILAQWVADETGCVGPSGTSQTTGVLLVYTTGARVIFRSRGGAHSLTITNVGANVATLYMEANPSVTPNTFVAKYVKQHLDSQRAAAHSASD